MAEDQRTRVQFPPPPPIFKTTTDHLKQPKTIDNHEVTTHLELFFMVYRWLQFAPKKPQNFNVLPQWRPRNEGV